MPTFYIQNAIQCRACTDISNITRRRKLGGYFHKLEICWFRVVHARSKERDLIFPPQIEEEAAYILVLVCPCVEHDQIFPIQFEEVGNMFDCPFI